MSDATEPRGSDHQLGGFDFSRLRTVESEDLNTLDPPVLVEKWFKISSDGIEFHGYEAAEAAMVIQTAAMMGRPDAVRYRPEESDDDRR